MSSRTSVFKQLPWIGGLNTNQDVSIIKSNQLVTGDHVVFDTAGSRKKRDGIKFNWDTNTTGSNSIIGMTDYWFGATSRVQRQVAVTSDRKIYSYSGGTATQLTVDGQAWSGTLTSVAFATYGNWLLIAVSGSNNSVKYWDGTNHVLDLYSSYQLTSISRASSGTTRTIVFNRAFPGAVSSTVVVTGGPSTYNGTFTVASLATTTVANDTITYTAGSSLTEGTTSDTAIDAGQLAPYASVCREHLGRVFMNDKTNPDLLHYCQAGNMFRWWGYGDSGGYPIAEGDGDPAGITAIFPTFQGDLFIAKKTKLYRCEGVNPEDYSINKVSDSIGCVSHNSVAPIDESDVFFVSEKGVHSLATTQKYGDFEASYVSIDIQKSFNDFNKGRLLYVWGAYLPSINSVAFTFSTSSSSYNNALYLYNIPLKSWYTWSGIACESLIVANDSDKKRFYIGSNTGRIAKTFNGTNYDVSASGTNTAVNLRITTGQIAPDGDNYTLKAFKRFVLFYKPQGNHTVTVNVSIDNLLQNAENSLSFSQTVSTDLLGSTFILGTSRLGANAVMGPYVRTIDGVGRGCKIDISQSGIDQTVEIQGFALEYEPAGTGYEIVSR